MKLIKDKSFKVEVVSPETEEDREIKRIVKEVKEEDKKRHPGKWKVVNNKKE